MSKQITPRLVTKQDRRRERREEQRLREEQLRRSKQRRRIALISGIAVLVVVIASFSIYQYVQRTQNVTGQSAVPTPVDPLFPAVDNGAVVCDSSTHDADFHIHAQLNIYINGQPVLVPQGIGVPTSQTCLYWLHTHSSDGVIHIEAPQGRTFVLGNFLHEWGTEFSQLGYPAQLDNTGGWQAYVCTTDNSATATPTTGATATVTLTPTPTVDPNCKLYSGDFNKISLSAHKIITLLYQSPGVLPSSFFNWNGL